MSGWIWMMQIQMQIHVLIQHEDVAIVSLAPVEFVKGEKHSFTLSACHVALRPQLRGRKCAVEGLTQRHGSRAAGIVLGMHTRLTLAVHTLKNYKRKREKIWR